jgi:hypothetical protein
MKLKSVTSLMLGSAAALFAVSAARAADAVVAPEPEPVEYVKVCDTYGTQHWFYIPGTQTCMRITGFVWYQIGAGDGPYQSSDGTFHNVNHTGGYYGSADGWLKTQRANIEFDARSETELGTLRLWLRMQSDFGDGYSDPAGYGRTFHSGVDASDNTVYWDQAFLQLGGLIMGFGESTWFYQFNNGQSSYGSHSWGGMYYGYQQRDQIRYEFGNGTSGLFGAIALEDDDKDYNWVPDVVGRLGWAAPWGTVWAVAAYDDSRGRNHTGGPFAIPSDEGNDEFAFTLATAINVPNSPGSSLRAFFYYETADGVYGPNSMFAGGAGNNGTIQPEWSVLLSYQQQFTPTFSADVGFQYFGNFYSPFTSSHSKHFAGDPAGDNAWAAEISAVWFPVENFEVRPEIVYTKAEHYDGTVSGYLRFTRYF